MKKWELVIFLSNACNLGCKHCDIPQEPKHSLDREQLESLAKYGPYKVNFLGGEPLIAENLDAAFEVFGDRPITVSTNGLLVPERIALLQKAREVLLSLEGTRKSTDTIRGKGVFNKVVKSAKLLRESGVEVTLRCSVWYGNLRDVPNLIRLAKRLDTGLMFFPMLGAAPLNPQGQVWLFRQLEAYDRAWVDQPHYFCFLGKETKCPAGWHRLAVDWNGEIFPCQWLRSYYLGKVGDSFDMIERNAETFVKTFKTCPTKCFGCEFMDSCSGSCRVSMSYTNCPLLPQGHRLRFSALERAQGGRKIKTLRSFLSGVVSC